MEFKSILFGKADAKEEGSEHPNLLIKGYLDSMGIIDIALNRTAFLFLGYKGSGKTALSEHIRLTARDFNSFVNDVQLKDFPYNSFSKIISGTSETEAKLPMAWEWLLLIYALSSLTNDESLNTEDVDYWDETLNAFKQMGIFPIRNIRDVVNLSTKKTFRINLMNCLEFNFEATDSFIPQDSFVHLVSFLKNILSNVHTNNKHYIIIDGLDEILLNKDIQYKSIAALISQAKDLNVFFRSIDLHVKLIVLCRTDIFERLPHPNKNKIRQDSSFSLNWFDESSAANYSNCHLIQLANLRCKLVYPEIEDMFSTFFPEKYRSQPTWQALLEYTRHTPRDFMQLLNKIQFYTNGKTVTPNSIEQGLKSYSIDYFLPEIKDELVGYLDYSKIDLFFNLLSTLRKRDFTIQDVRTVKNQNPIFGELNIEEILAVMFECSAIGHLVGIEQRHCIKYRNRNMSFNPSERILLHKGLWKALII